MLLDYTLGQTSIVLRVKFRSTSGSGLAGLGIASTGLIIAAIADNEAVSTAYSVAASKLETIATLGAFVAPTATKARFKEVDSVNHPGVYEIQLDNTRYAVTSAKYLIVSWSGATNLNDSDCMIPLRATNSYDGVSGGISRLDASVQSVAPSVWNTLMSGVSLAGTFGLKLKNWVLGADSKALLSSDPQTGVIIPTVTSVGTVNTYTGNTPQTGDSFAQLNRYVAFSPNGTVKATPAPQALTMTLTIAIPSGLSMPPASSFPGLQVRILSGGMWLATPTIASATLAGGSDVNLTFVSPGFSIPPVGGESALLF